MADILKQLDAKLQRKAEGIFNQAIEDILRLYRERFKVGGTSNSEYELDRALKEAFAKYKTHYVSTIKESLDRKFFDELDSVTKLIARELNDTDKD